MRMAQGLLNSVQKERDALREEIVQLKAKVKQADTSSAIEVRLVEVCGYRWECRKARLIK